MFEASGDGLLPARVLQLGSICAPQKKKKKRQTENIPVDFFVEFACIFTRSSRQGHSPMMARLTGRELIGGRAVSIFSPSSVARRGPRPLSDANLQNHSRPFEPG